MPLRIVMARRSRPDSSALRSPPQGGLRWPGAGHNRGMDEQLAFAHPGSPSGLELEVAALKEHVARGSHPEYADDVDDVIDLRRAVQLCSVGLGETTVHLAGSETPASQVVAALDLDLFVERRIHGWAQLN